MRFLIIFSIFSFVLSASQPHQEDELPFKTDNFPNFFDESSSSSGEDKDELALSYADQADALKKRLKQKSMFNTNGPPAIGTDLFSNVAVEENIKSRIESLFSNNIHFLELSYEGSGVDENQEKSEENASTFSTVAEDSLYSANNSTKEDESVEASSNSSITYDQNTSDAEVETISDMIYQKNEASAILAGDQNESSNEKIIPKKAETKTLMAQQQSYSGDEQNTTKVSCPPPKMCRRNCFVTINEDGCQDCQCFWIAADCETDKDCKEKHQYCDLGKCNCQPGYKQNMRKSGVCEVDPETSSNLVETISETGENGGLDTNNISKEESKRSKRNTKPRRSERLEWPGVCDKNEQCPENLVCIHGDCWSVPDKSKRLDPNPSPKPTKMIISRNTDEEEETKRVSFDTDEIMEPSPVMEFTLPPIVTTTSPLPPTTEPPKRGMSRFVSEDFAKQLQRTTAKVKKYDWFPPTTTIASLITQFPMTTNHVPPLTVERFFMIETTVPPPLIIKPSPPPPPKKILNDHKMEYMKDRKPNFLGVKEEANDLDYPSSQSHIKKIHLEMPPTLLPHRRKHKKLRTTTPFPEDASEIEEKSEVDEIEFPISSKIKNGAMKPRALSAEPTREELKDHKSLVELFNAHAASTGITKELNDDDTSSQTKPSFQILQSFSNPEPTPEIQVTLVGDHPNSQFSPIPDLLNTDPNAVERKPYIIQNKKFTTISPLSNISGDMASDDPPEVTPQPAPFEQHKMGIWYPMKKGDIPHLGIFTGEFRRAPRKNLRTADDLRLYNEYTKANRQNRPIRIEMDNATEFVRNECREDKHCGNTTKCCTKKWCDRTNNCGVGKFCLPSCDSTKLTFLPSSNNAESVIDIMYD